MVTAKGVVKLIAIEGVVNVLSDNRVPEDKEEASWLPWRLEYRNRYLSFIVPQEI
jgi:hypothetical protein